MLLIQTLKIFNGRITSRNSMSGVLSGTSYPIFIRTSEQIYSFSSSKQ